MAQNTPCIRCGKERIVAKSWKEQVAGSWITHALTVCPDKECQKLVDLDLQKKKDRLTAIQNETIKRRSAMQKAKKSKTS